MDGARLSRFPHHSWLGISLRVPPSDAPRTFRLHSVAHAIHLTIHRSHTTRWIRQGREVRWLAPPGQVHFLPADGHDHEFLAHATAGYDSFLLLLPQGHLRAIARQEGVGREVVHQRLLLDDDRILQACLLRLAAPSTAADDGPDDSQDEAARRLVLRLVERSGGGTPDWHDDMSTFDRRTLGRLVDHIDAHLRAPPALGDLARLVGMSPSHFARKFRQSTGLSLHRFVNRRRLRRAFGLLAEGTAPVAEVADDLGFASQSHFTRLFSDLTGHTPARFRREHQLCRRH